VKTLTRETLPAVLGAALVLCPMQAGAAGRDYISIVGSSTVYPFATVVAERFGRDSGFKTPKIESTGSGGGLKLFCAGVGPRHPDMSNASRRIKKSEVERCGANGVAVIEIKVGYDGIVIANGAGAPDFNLSLRDVFMALAKEVPAGGEITASPNRTWNDVRAGLPDTPIEVLGPPPTSGTRDAFVELAMEGGCQWFPQIKALKKSDKARYKTICHTMREDGAYVDAGENDNLIVQKLAANPRALGIFGFSFLDQNRDVIKGIAVDEVAPQFDSIADGSYPVSRALFVYVKKDHIGVIPGMAEFIGEFLGERAAGEDGYLADRGMIPLGDAERAEMQSRIGDLTVL